MAENDTIDPRQCNFVLLDILRAMGSEGPPHQSPNWNHRADLNGDNVVNVRDFMVWRSQCTGLGGDADAVDGTGKVTATVDFGEGITLTVSAPAPANV